MTAADAADAFPRAPNGSVLLDCTDEVIAAGWPEATLPANDRAQRELIDPNAADQQFGRNVSHGSSRATIWNQAAV